MRYKVIGYVIETSNSRHPFNVATFANRQSAMAFSVAVGCECVDALEGTTLVRS